LGGGKFANGAMTASFGYLFNQMSPKGRDPNLRGDIAVEQAKEMFIERGYTIVDDQVEANIKGYPIRRYDFVVTDKNDVMTGVEVKSTIGDLFKLNQKQVAFDLAVYESGAQSIYGTITRVGYVGVNYGNIPKTFQSVALQLALAAKNVNFTVLIGLKVSGK
jgi:hypothetical protein